MTQNTGHWQFTEGAEGAGQPISHACRLFGSLCRKPAVMVEGVRILCQKPAVMVEGGISQMSTALGFLFSQ